MGAWFFSRKIEVVSARLTLTVPICLGISVGLQNRAQETAGQN
jgi:hypothetical protein